eukprot:8456463-Lingulodinium_polyedra.AAC.1
MLSPSCDLPVAGSVSRPTSRCARQARSSRAQRPGSAPDPPMCSGSIARQSGVNCTLSLMTWCNDLTV